MRSNTLGNIFCFLLISALFVLIFNACSKKDLESTIDCVGESLLISISHPADANDPKTINYAVNYSGDKTVASVDWDFGDGSSQTVNNTTISHSYTTSGNYTVKVKVHLKSGSATCTSEPQVTVTVN